MIIGFCGNIGCGKDYISNHFKELGFKKISFADKMKVVLSDYYEQVDYDRLHDQSYKKEIFGIPIKLDYKVLKFIGDSFGVDITKVKAKTVINSRRELLQVIGTDYLRAVSRNIHVDSAIRDLEDGNYVISDVRFMNELRVCDYVFWLERVGSNGTSTHSSENSIKKNKCIIIDNNGDLETTMKEITIHLGVDFKW